MAAFFFLLVFMVTGYPFILWCFFPGPRYGPRPPPPLPPRPRTRQEKFRTLGFILIGFAILIAWTGLSH